MVEMEADIVVVINICSAVGIVPPSSSAVATSAYVKILLLNEGDDVEDADVNLDDPEFSAAALLPNILVVDMCREIARCRRMMARLRIRL